MINKVHLKRINKSKTIQCINTSTKDQLGNNIGQIRSITLGKYYEDLSDAVTHTEGFVAIRNDNSAVVLLKASRFNRNANKEFTKSLQLPVSDTDRFQKLIQTYEGAE